MSDPKFCVFCGSETQNAQMALDHKEKYDEYKQIAALACLALDMLANDYDHDEHFHGCVKAENEKIIRMQTDKQFREETYNTVGALFSLPVAKG